jgi:AraC-like DNA-binding protein
MSKARLHGQIAAPDAVLTLLGEAPGVRVIDHDCRKPAGDRGSYEYSLDFGLVFVRRGGYWREVNGQGTYLGPTDAFFERPCVEQRIAHHRDAGDRCTSLWLSERAVCALTGDACVPDGPITTTPTVDLRHRELIVALRRGIDRFEFDERLAQLVGTLTERAAPGRFTARRSTTRTSHYRIVQHAREAIVSDPAGTDFADMARVLGHTRFHVSRVFSRATGMTLSQFRNRVRVAIALDRLADGHENLALLSADLGFVDQSHLSQVIRTYAGERLSELRPRLGQLDRPGSRQEPTN